MSAKKTDAAIVAERTADTSKTATDEYVKVFVINYKPDPGYDHTPNILATLRYAHQVGLRPTGDAIFRGTEPHLGDPARGFDLTYTVPVAPAGSDETTE